MGSLLSSLFSRKNSKTFVKHEVCELLPFSIKRVKFSTPHQGWVETQSGQKLAQNADLQGTLN